MTNERSVQRGFWTETTDEELMALVQVGNLDAFDEIVARYQDGLFRFLRSYTSSTAIAEDLLQETFLKVYTQRERYKNQGNFKAWLYRIARNLCIDHKRALGRRPVGHWIAEEDLAPDGIENFDKAIDEADDARDHVFTRELEEKMQDALAMLSKREREAFLLRRVEEMSYEEISQTLGCTLSAAKMRVKRAFDKIAGFMKGVVHEEVQTDTNSACEVRN
jgi:RNA polymerase sigma-70 factor (ECF subfamily)